MSRQHSILFATVLVALCAGVWSGFAQTVGEKLADEALDKVKEAAEEKGRQELCEATGTQGLTCKPPPDPSDCVEACLERNRKEVQDAVDFVADEGSVLCKRLGKFCDFVQENAGPAGGTVVGDLDCKLFTPKECKPDEPDEPTEPDDPGGPGGGGAGGGGGSSCSNCGESRNDPLLRTFDGLGYEFQLVGEFVLAETDDLLVQVRYEPQGPSASYTSVTALRYDNHVVVFRSGSTSVWIDGEAHNLDAHAPFIVTHQLAVALKGNKFVVLAGDHRLYVSVNSRRLDLRLQPNPASQGRWTGLFGDFNGTIGDLKARDGKAFDPRVRTAALKNFGDSWRLSQDESLLPYVDDQSTKSFTDRTFPKEKFQLSAVPDENFQKYAKLCRENGVVDGAALHGCIYDLAVSGDLSLASTYADALPIVAAKETAQTSANVTVRVPKSVIAGGVLPIFWSGPRKGRKSIVLLGASGKEIGKTSAGLVSPHKWSAPTKEGTYSVEFTIGAKKATATVVVTPIVAALTAPKSVRGAASIEFTVTAPRLANGFVALMTAGQTDLKKAIRTLRVVGGGPMSLNAPAKGGRYELVHGVAGSDGKRVLGRHAIEVAEASAGIKHAPKVEAGAIFDLELAAPLGSGDFVTLFAAGDKKQTYLVRVGANAKTKTMRAPVTTGAYKVRYVAKASDGAVALAESDLIVTPASAKLDAPETVTGGTNFRVAIEGPRRRGDRIALMPPGKEGLAENVGVVRANRATTTLAAPNVPGTYQLFYVLAGSGSHLGKVIARREITITLGTGTDASSPGKLSGAAEPMPPTNGQLGSPLLRAMTSTVESVELELPDVVAAYSYFEVKLKVKGKVGMADVIEIVEVGGDKAVRTASAMMTMFPMFAPEKPGTYEVRFVSTPDLNTRKVVAKAALKVSPEVPISIVSPRKAVAGRPFEITIAGHIGPGGLVIVVKPGVKPLDFSKEGPGNFGLGQIARGKSKEVFKAQVMAPRSPGTYELHVVGRPRASGFKIFKTVRIVITEK